MKNIIKILLLIFTFSIFISSASAAVYQGTITGTDVILRTGPGTNYQKINFTLYKNQTYDMVDNKPIKSEKGCNSGNWYQIKYDGSKTGYVCSSYVSVSSKVINSDATSACEKDLKEKGFPSTYWTGLCSLKASHPSWNFEALITNLDWSTAVSKESSCGKSYIASSDPANINYACKNQYTKTWYPASTKAVSYYMDPRNFFSEKHIFQFLSNKYGSSMSSENYKKASETMLKNAAFYKYHGAKLSIAIDAAGKTNDVSPIFISARMLQELGSSNSLENLYSGVYAGFEGFYNFFNIGVTDSCATSTGTTLCGLNYAKDNNWQGLDASISGGVASIAKGYINAGQYTTYLQKFNVKPNNINSLYVHQYMTNVGAPSSESTTTYNTYSKLDLLNNAFTFYIPVYDNMDNSNYTNDGATPDDNKTNLSDTDIDTLVTSSGYRTSGNILSNIVPNSTIKNVISFIETMSGNNSVTITDQVGKPVSEGYVGTGFKITVKNSKTSKTYVALVRGDTSGEGIVNALDLLQVQKNILGTYALDSVYKMAGDTNNDSLVNALDLLQIQKQILGTYTIVQ